jgi:ferredoxin
MTKLKPITVTGRRCGTCASICSTFALGIGNNFDEFDKRHQVIRLFSRLRLLNDDELSTSQITYPIAYARSLSRLPPPQCTYYFLDVRRGR